MVHYVSVVPDCCPFCIDDDPCPNCFSDEHCILTLDDDDIKKFNPSAFVSVMKSIFCEKAVISIMVV